MTLYKKLILAFVFFILSSSAVYAASSAFLNQAKSYYNKVCKLKGVPDSIASECYLFDKVGEIDSALTVLTTRATNLENKNISQDTEIQSLKNRVKALEDNATKAPSDFQFFNGLVLPAGSTSATFDAQGYAKITLTYQAQTSLYLNVSPDGSTWVLQREFGEGDAKAGGSITLSTAGRYYSISTGSTTLPANQVSANVLGHFSN